MTSHEARIEAAAKASHKARQARGFSGTAEWEYEPAEIRSLFMESTRAAITAYLAGDVVVPREATATMIDAANLNGALGTDEEIASDYRAMVSAATEMEQK